MADVGIDYVVNNQPSGDVARSALGCVLNGRIEPGLAQPFLHDRTGRRCVRILGKPILNQKTGQYEPRKVTVECDTLERRGIRHPTWNATAMRYRDWVRVDQAVVRAARLRLQFWADLSAANSYGGFNALGVKTLEYEAMNDPGEAVVDMDGTAPGRSDTPLFQLEALPLPITHSDFTIKMRDQAVSANSNTPLNVTMGEAAGRRVAETIEKTAIGVQTGVTYSPLVDGSYVGRTPTCFGLLNFPQNQVYASATAPTATGWSPDWTRQDVLAMRQKLYNNRFFGPFNLYYSNDWDTYLDGSYYKLTTSGAVAPTQTLRTALESIAGVNKVQRLDWLMSAALSNFRPFEKLSTYYPFTMIMVQMTREVAEAINGQDITTMQWEVSGGWEIRCRVWAIQVARFRADYYGNCGICVGTMTAV
jgi:hypothetical protein